MTNEVAKPQKIILMRSGAEIWIDEDRMDKLFNLINTGNSKMIEIDGEIINSVDISGIYDPFTIEELHRSKSGQWKCHHGNWIPRGRRCQCTIKPEYRDY